MPKLPVKSAIGKALQAKGAKKQKKRTEPCWKGPQVDGITQSLLNQFFSCPERFRIKVIEGLAVEEGFNHSLEYGNMWHICEEFHARREDYQKPLKDYCTSLAAQYSFSQEAIFKWYNVCLKQFPEYVKHWAKHKDEKKRTPLMQEVAFKVPLTLPSGKVVLLRGKWDQVDLIGKEIWLKENKTKGSVDDQRIARQLSFDNQTMLYLVALREYDKLNGPLSKAADGAKIAGVRYNVIRRPLSGGKGSIKQHSPTKSNPQGESTEDFYERLRRDYLAAEPDYWFCRWNVDIVERDIIKFKEECLVPILEYLCRWYDFVESCLVYETSPFDSVRQREWDVYHYRLPFGVYNPLAEVGFTEVDEYLATGSTVGLKEVRTLFPELE